ncbi:MAG: MarR family transcriptional regulator, partial [Flavobacteriales bacterium]|nr:MarR family transcriptional regulator [Flavobacteriales bacterium]
YVTENIDIEPSWHLVLLFLKKHKKATMSEISVACHLPQPAATKMISNMRKKKYLDLVADDNDGRKKQLQLSKKAILQFPTFEKVWNAGQLSIKEMLTGNKIFLEALTKFENKNQQNNFQKRAIKNL